MSDAIVRDILQGWKRPLDMAALKQAADHGNDGLHDEDHPLTYRVGDLHVVVARAPWQGPEEHGAAVGATAEEAANKLLAMIGEPKQPAPTISEESVSHETLADELPTPAADVPAVVSDAGSPLGDADAPADVPVAYSGVALVRDELGFLRNHVQAKIVAGLLLRLDANADESRLAWLAQALSDYMNLREQRAPISEQVQKNYDEWVEWKDFKSNIIDGAVALMRAAEHADMPMLQVMAVNPWTAG